ncbi:hypothetical protein BGZ79_005041, partial [Entomortierella chlamydospora]
MSLFSALLNYRHNAALEETTQEDTSIEAIEAHEHTNYPFTLSVEDFGSSLGLTMQSIQPYDSSTICGYMQHALQNLANALERAPETSIQSVEVLPTEERDLIIHDWNKTDTAYPSDRCIHQIFEDQVKSSPEAIAIVHNDRTLTYRELNCRANWIARQLVDAGIQHGDYVLILLNRSIDLVAAQLAILKVGAAYVPIDTKAPVDRQVYVASDSGAKLLITDEDTDVPVQIQTPLLRVSATEVNTDVENDLFDDHLNSSVSSLDTAYVMYTSGSTGRPKGVMVSHRGIARFVVNNGFSPMTSEDRVAFVSNPSFDHNTFDVWTPLLNGARIVIIDNDIYLDPHRLEAALELYQITALLFTTALFHQYAFIIGPALSKLKYLACAGEQGLIEAFTEMLRHGGPVRLVNAYGPTE